MVKDGAWNPNVGLVDFSLFHSRDKTERHLYSIVIKIMSQCAFSSTQEMTST